MQKKQSPITEAHSEMGLCMTTHWFGKSLGDLAVLGALAALLNDLSG
jgi:hypothetical protein